MNKQEIEQHFAKINKLNEEYEKQRQKAIRKNLFWARLKQIWLKIS